MDPQGPQGKRHYQRPERPPPPPPPAPVMQPESGNAASNALADVVNKSAAPFQNLANPNVSAFDKAQGVVNGVMGLASAPTDLANDLFARATNSIAKVFPSFPAATMGSLVIGIPHLHAKPPALPWPLPGIGVVMTSCPTVLIGGMPAARSGDYGLGPTCGSIFPIFEIFTGSSKVFIGGSRAARVVDLTRQCMPAPKGAGAAGKAAKAAAAAGKVKKVLNVVKAVAPVLVPAAMGIYGVSKRGDETKAAAEAAQENADAAMEDEEASAADAVDAAAEAQSAAAEAAGAALAASMMGADLAMNAMQMAMGALMGKDPGTPPCIGMVTMGVSNVLIGGFPMPSWSDLAKGLKKLTSMIKKGRRGGKAAGKWFCFGCM